MLQKELKTAQAQIRQLQSQLNRLPLAVLNGTASPRAPAGGHGGGGAELRHKQRAAANAPRQVQPGGGRPTSPRDSLANAALSRGGGGGDSGRQRTALTDEERRQRLSELDPSACKEIEERRGQMESLKARLVNAQAQQAAEMTMAAMAGRPLTPGALESRSGVDGSHVRASFE